MVQNTAPENVQCQKGGCCSAPYCALIIFALLILGILAVFFGFYNYKPENQAPVAYSSVYPDLVASFGASPVEKIYYNFGSDGKAAMVFTKVLSLKGKDLYVDLRGKIEVGLDDTISEGTVVIGVTRAECFKYCVADNVRILMPLDEAAWEWRQSIIRAQNKAKRLSKSGAPSSPQLISPPTP